MFHETLVVSYVELVSEAISILDNFPEIILEATLLVQLHRLIWGFLVILLIGVKKLSCIRASFEMLNVFFHF